MDDARLRDLCIWARRRAEQKISRALRIETLRLADQPHEKIRVQLGLTVEQYRRSKRWLRDAVGSSAASAGHVTVEEALREHGERQVEEVLRYGMLKSRGRPRVDILAQMRISSEAAEMLDEWWRDGLAATAPQVD